MLQIVQKIEDYKKNSGTYGELSEKTGISKTLLYKLRKGKGNKFNPIIIKDIYDFFELGYDEFYYSNMEKWKKDDNFGFLVRRKRIDLGITMKGLAFSAGVKVKTISRIETGVSFNNKISMENKVIYKIKEILNLSEKEINNFIY